MAVHTQLTVEEFFELVSGFDLGTLSSWRPIEDGVENSTYTIALQSGNNVCEYVLTIYEQATIEQLQFMIRLICRLRDAGFPVPAPERDSRGRFMQRIREKTSLLFPRFAGSHTVSPNPEQCRRVGRLLAEMHREAAGMEEKYNNHLGVLWLSRAAEVLCDHLSPGESALFREQADRYRRITDDCPDVPQGAIHGELTRDNVLFDGDSLMGVLDFDSACTDWLLLDVAIAINDWCSDDQGDLEREQTHALLEAYHEIRPFTHCERQYWQDMLCFAASRFWVNRMLDHHIRYAIHPTIPQKDPDEYRRILQNRMVSFIPLPH